jgi:hypothetical protein
MEAQEKPEFLEFTPNPDFSVSSSDYDAIVQADLSKANKEESLKPCD